MVDCPAVRFTPVELAANVQLAGTVTTSDKEKVCVTPPPVAMMVSGYEPVLTVLAVVSVRVLAAGPLTVDGEKAAVTPVGKAEMERETAELNPFWGVAAIAIWPLLPSAILRDAALGASVNVGLGITTGIASVPVNPLPLAVSRRL